MRVEVCGLWVRGVRRWNGERREWTSKHRVKLQTQDRDALIFSSTSPLRFRHLPFPTPFRPFNSQSYSHYNHLILILLLYLARGDSFIPTCARRSVHCSSSRMPQNLFEYPRLSVFFRERTLWDLSWSHHKAQQPRSFRSRTDHNRIFSYVLFVIPDARGCRDGTGTDHYRMCQARARFRVRRPPSHVLRDDNLSHLPAFHLTNLASTGFFPFLPTSLSLNRAPCLLTRKHRLPTHPLFHPPHSTLQPTQQAQPP